MRISHFLFFKTCKNLIGNGSWTNYQKSVYSCSLLGTHLKCLKSYLIRELTIYNSLFINNAGIYDSGDVSRSYENKLTKNKIQETSKKKKTPKVSVINENNHEMVMNFEDAEKYAKRKNMHLVPVEGSRKDKLKYKLISDISEEKKTKQKHLKRIIFTEKIADHDLQIKLNQMTKLLNKGLRVVCFIEGTPGGQVMNTVISKLEKSKLKDFLLENVKKPRGVKLVYQGNASNEENTDVSNMEPS